MSRFLCMATNSKISYSQTNLSRPADQDLWNQFRTGNSQALFELYKRLHVPLVNYCFKLCGDKQQAQDTFSELMIALWDKREKLREVKNVRSYLMTTLRRQLISDLKLLHQFDEISEDNSSSEESCENDLINAQEEEQLKESLKFAFAKLTPRQRQFITLRFYDGLSYEEIVEKTGVDIKVVYNKIYEGIKILRKYLPGEYKGSSSFLIFFLLFQERAKK